jgi:hypothetical protein
MLHVNIGPSPLALGLLIPCTLQADFDVCVVGRAGGTNLNRYSISPSGGRLSFRSVRWFEGPQQVTDLPDGLLERLRSNEGLLITGSLRADIVEREDFLRNLVELRPADAETVLLACENAEYDSYARLGRVLEARGGLYLRTVVNRMCLGLEADGGMRRVSIHPLGEWLIERPAGRCQVLEQLEQQAHEVELVDDIEAREDRKLWMVNGAHQALAIYGRRGRRSTLMDDRDDDLRQTAVKPEVIARLSHLHSAMDYALRQKYDTLEDSLEYALRHVLAYTEHQDSVSRVLESLRRADLAPFLRTMSRRLGDPARVCARSNHSTDAFRHVVDELERLMKDPYAYAEGEDVFKAEMDAERDAEAVDAYRSLLADWMSDPEVEQRARLLEDVLTEQREAQAPPADDV